MARWSGPTPPADEGRLLILVGPIVAWLGLWVALIGWHVDDAGITYAYARSLAGGLGFRAHAEAAVGMLPGKMHLDDLKLPPLETAVELLRADIEVSPQGKSRARRAWAKLEAYADRALRTEDATKLRTAARDLAGPPPGSQPRGDRDGAMQKGTEVATEVVKDEKEYYKSPPAILIGTTCAAMDPTFTGPQWSNGKTGVAARMTIPLPPDKVATHIDPQAWDECSPFFSPKERTYIAVDNGKVKPGCVFDPADNPNMDPTHAAGSAYKTDKFFEHYNCSVCSAEFKNFLSVTTWVNAPLCEADTECPTPAVNPAYQVCYDLPVSASGRSLAGCVNGAPATILLDTGSLTACAVPAKVDATDLRVTKTILFDYANLNVGAYVVYLLAQKEFVDSAAEIACCNTCN